MPVKLSVPCAKTSLEMALSQFKDTAVKVYYSIGITLGRYRVEEQGLGLVTVGKHGVRLH